jgi:hemoglobin
MTNKHNWIRAGWNAHRVIRIWNGAAIAMVLVAVATGCGSAKSGKKKDEFFTSGSREADQRASQTMARNEQLTGEGEGAGEKGKKKKSESVGDNGTNKAAQVEGKLALFERLGSEAGISNIISDFLPRVLQDPRVNWERKGAGERNSWFHSWFRRNSTNSVAWNATPENVANLHKHLVQFLSLATGGPAQYDGKEMKTVHAGMKIANAEFDAVIGDLKASLDKLQIPNKEQKELLAIIESTRPQVVTQR